MGKEQLKLLHLAGSLNGHTTAILRRLECRLEGSGQIGNKDRARMRAWIDEAKEDVRLLDEAFTELQQYEGSLFAKVG